jgi:hypothetical protein
VSAGNVKGEESTRRVRHALAATLRQEHPQLSHAEALLRVEAKQRGLEGTLPSRGRQSVQDALAVSKTNVQSDTKGP